MHHIRASPPQPCIEIQLLSSKCDKAINDIVYLDTRAQKSMMDPNILKLIGKKV